MRKVTKINPDHFEDRITFRSFGGEVKFNMIELTPYYKPEA